MNRLISIILCFGLLLPMLETLVVEFGVLDCGVLTSIVCEENEETEKEEKTQKELENFYVSESVLLVLSSKHTGWIENSLFHHSWIDEIPSPPPDYCS